MESVDVLGVQRNYSSLSVRDLLEARDQYHFHLIHKKNVVGTAIGLYRIRKSDPWPTETKADDPARPYQPKGERTFENSEVRDYSWPAVLVLVDQWQEIDDFGGSGRLHPQEMVPRTLFMPDGRTVPVCVVKVNRTTPDVSLLPRWHWPEHLIGGGFPIISTAQESERIASVGALVTDGHTVFALTSRHVTGPEGQALSTLMAGHTTEVGLSSARQVIRRPFSEVYKEFPGRRTFLTIDAGLVEVSKLDDWTSQVYGLADVSELADLSEQNISLRLINARVVAYGAASGELRGYIAALFYRHRSIGGYDDVTDFLIAPEADSSSSQPGDSGTVWHLIQERDKTLRPLALQWGGQAFIGGEKTFNFALAASLSNVLRLLEVELVVEHNTGAVPFWGKTGHYSLATFACDQISSNASNLRQLIKANRNRISFVELDPKKIDEATKAAKQDGGFVPLADVADVIWKNVPSKVKGGRDTSQGQGPEHPVHYADIDEPRDSDGQTLRELCLADPANVSVGVWQQFYDALGHTKSKERGLLPFRVWQFFDEMVDAVVEKDLVRYVCAAGLMAHYVGDACQPLHGSVLADGHPDGSGKGIHSAYETAMIDHQATAVVAGIQEKLQTVPRPANIGSGQEAALAIVRLMDRAAQAVDPEELVDFYAPFAPSKAKKVTSKLWDEFGAGTVRTLADGAMTLAVLWESAWLLATGELKFTQQDMKAVSKAKLQKLYEDPDFVESLDLDHIEAELSEPVFS